MIIVFITTMIIMMMMVIIIVVVIVIITVIININIVNTTNKIMYNYWYKIRSFIFLFISSRILCDLKHMLNYIPN